MRGIIGVVLGAIALVAAPAKAQDKPLTVQVPQTSAGSLHSNAA